MKPEYYSHNRSSRSARLGDTLLCDNTLLLEDLKTYQGRWIKVLIMLSVFCLGLTLWQSIAVMVELKDFHHPKQIWPLSDTPMPAGIHWPGGEASLWYAALSTAKELQAGSYRGEHLRKPLVNKISRRLGRFLFKPLEAQFWPEYIRHVRNHLALALLSAPSDGHSALSDYTTLWQARYLYIGGAKVLRDAQVRQWALRLWPADIGDEQSAMLNEALRLCADWHCHSQRKDKPLLSAVNEHFKMLNSAQLLWLRAKVGCAARFSALPIGSSLWADSFLQKTPSRHFMPLPYFFQSRGMDACWASRKIQELYRDLSVTQQSVWVGIMVDMAEQGLRNYLSQWQWRSTDSLSVLAARMHQWSMPKGVLWRILKQVSFTLKGYHVFALRHAPQQPMQWL